MNSHRRVPKEIQNLLRRRMLELHRTCVAPDWNELREAPEFAPYFGAAAGEAGRRMFYRLRASILKVPASNKTRPHEGAEVANEALALAVCDARRLVDQNLPPAPPAYIQRAGKLGMENLHLSAAFMDAWNDWEEVRRASYADGEITDAKRFIQSIVGRFQALGDFVRLQKEIYDLEAQQAFHQAIRATIVEELAGYPDVQRRVIQRLKALNDRHGMTIHAGAAR